MLARSLSEITGGGHGAKIATIIACGACLPSNMLHDKKMELIYIRSGLKGQGSPELALKNEKRERKIDNLHSVITCCT